MPEPRDAAGEAARLLGDARQEWAAHRMDFDCTGENCEHYGCATVEKLLDAADIITAHTEAQLLNHHCGGCDGTDAA